MSGAGGFPQRTIVCACEGEDEYVRVLASTARARVVGASAPLLAIPIVGSALAAARVASDLAVAHGEAKVFPDLPSIDEASRIVDAALERAPSSAGIVLVVGEAYESFARGLALLSGRRFARSSPTLALRTLAALAGNGAGRSVTLVGAPSVFSAEVVAALLGWGTPGDSASPSRAFPGGAPMLDVPFGIVTARSKEAVSRVVARSLCLASSPRRPSFSVLATASPGDEAERASAPGERPLAAGDRAPDRDVRIAWASFDPSAAAQLERDLFDVLALTSHGDPIDLHLSGVVLCGRAFDPKDGRKRPPLSGIEHTCMAEDHCPRTRGGEVPRLRADQVRCRVLFAETCTGIALRDRVFPEALAVGLSALEGTACAYLSTAKVVRSTGFGAILAEAMLASGVTLGETARTVDAVHGHLASDAPSFLLMGDPDAQLSPRRSSVVLRARLSEEGTASLEFGRFEGSLLVVRLEGDRASALAGDPDVEPVVAVSVRDGSGTASLAEARAVAVPNVFGAPLALIVASPTPFAASAMSIVVEDGRVTKRRLANLFARVDRRLVQLDAIRTQVAAYPTRRQTAATKACVEELTAVVASARALVGQGLVAFHGAQNRVACVGEALVPNACEALEVAIRRQLAVLDGFLAGAVPRWELPQYQVPLYGDVLFAAARETPAGSCYRCGLPAFDLSFDAYARPDLRRVVTHCAGCDLLFDRPDDEVGVTIVGDAPVRRGTTVRRELVVTNDDDHPRVFAMSAWIEGTHAWLDVSFSPPSQVFEIPANTTASVTFDVTVGPNTAPGIYRFTAFTTSELSWSLSGEPFTVTR